ETEAVSRNFWELDEARPPLRPETQADEIARYRDRQKRWEEAKALADSRKDHEQEDAEHRTRCDQRRCTHAAHILPRRLDFTAGGRGCMALACAQVETARRHDTNRLDRVPPIAGYREDRESSERPGDVVDEDVFAPEDDSGPDDRVTETGRLQRF